MPRSSFAPLLLMLVGLTLSPGLAHADAPAQGTGLAVVDFAYADTSGEPADQTAAHRELLQTFMANLRKDLAAGFHLVSVSCGAAPCFADQPPTDDLLRSASQAGAKILLIGAIHKMSTLVQWAKVSAIDVEARRVVFDKLITFRGDSNEAWARAESFVSGEVLAALAPPIGYSSDLAAPRPTDATAAAPIKLTLFDFELEDFSAAASSTGEAPSDTARLASVTSEVRQLLAQSGRYDLIDVGGAQAAAVKARALRESDGCDAAIARQLGAEQSLVGVVRRISRTEYIVRFQLRDARTGAIVSSGNSGLRMGADYSWNRGAVRLIKDQLLESHDRQPH
jgi:Protein of unknown function (DUF2380)